MAEFTKLVGIMEKDVYSGTADICRKIPEFLPSIPAVPSSVVTVKL